MLRIVMLVVLAMFTISSTRAAQPMVQAIGLPEGGIHPQAQVDSRGRVHLIYFAGDARRGDIFYIRSDEAGVTFTSPIRVNSHPASAIVAGTIRGPHIAIGKGDRPHVAWMGSDKAEPKAAGKHTPMLYTRLSDTGDHFEPQRNVIQNHPGLDGGGAVAADRDGNVYVAWHAPDKGDPLGHDEQDRQVWLARSRDDGKTFDAETAAIPTRAGVCACCGLNILARDGGRVFIVFRAATANVNRDMHLLASNDFGHTFAIAASDPWTIGKCVMSTAALAPRGERDVLAVWETKEQVHLATVNDSKASTAPVPVPGAAKQRKHPTIAVNDKGEYAVAWTEGAGWNKGGDVVWQLFDASGRPIQGQAGRFSGLVPWSLPTLVATPDGHFKIAY